MTSPHPGKNHEFRTTCSLCGEPGFLNVSLITYDEMVTISPINEPVLLDTPRFRAAVDATFAAPGEFGPAKGYYGSATDHFIEMLKEEYRRG